MIGILDYGMANLRSVQKAFAQNGHDAQIIQGVDQIRQADRLVVPGVGAFRDAIAHLRQGSFDQAILDYVKLGRPLLGICLGMQLFFDVGFEDGEHKGLGIIAGECVRFDVDHTLRLKVPHMGWNQLSFKRPCPLFKGLNDGCNVYFVHSYHVVPKEADVVATTTEYGPAFVSAIWRDNVVATQFHPEKSQAVGLKILANFAAM